MKTAPQTAHTPLPWHAGVNPSGFVYGPAGEQVADLREMVMPEEVKANAELIVRAVNSHEELFDALCAALPFVEDALKSKDFKPGYVAGRARMIRSAIARATQP